MLSQYSKTLESFWGYERAGLFVVPGRWEPSDQKREKAKYCLKHKEKLL